MATSHGIAVYTLTLTSADTNYKLSTLIAAVNPDERTRFSEIQLRAVDGIDGVGSNTNDVLVGDAYLSTSRYYRPLSAGDSTYLSDGSGRNGETTTVWYLRSAGAGQKVCFLGRVA
jgi:hypothetical protein